VIDYFLIHSSWAVRKGVGSISDRDKPNCTDLSSLNLDWYYNWLPTSVCSKSLTASFVPMIWGPMLVNQTVVVDKSAEALLGFNEPDLMLWSPSDMAHLWPKLEATGMRLGSPAPSACPNSYLWLDQFFGNCTNCRVDFVVVHQYAGPPPMYEGPCTGDNLIKKINFYAKRYKRPVWVTEFDCPKNTMEENLAFMHDALPRLKKECPMLERFAWFTTRPSNIGGDYLHVHLIDTEGQKTMLGNYYTSFPNSTL